MNLNCIVVVDSDEISHFILKKHFKDSRVDCEIKFFRDVEDGINFIYDYSICNNDYCPELILVDINMNMAGKDGNDFLEIFSHMKFVNKKKVKLVLLSSIFPKEIGYKKSLQKLKILLKPISKDQLNSFLKIKEKELTLEAF